MDKYLESQEGIRDKISDATKKAAVKTLKVAKSANPVRQIARHRYQKARENIRFSQQHGLSPSELRKRTKNNDWTHMYKAANEDFADVLATWEMEALLVDGFFESEGSQSLEHFAVGIGFDLSEEGLVEWAIDNTKAVVSKFEIFANEAWSRISGANAETREAIKRAEAAGFDHNEALPVGKATSMVVGLAAMVAAVGACVVAGKAIKAGIRDGKQISRDRKAAELHKARAERDAYRITRGKTRIDEKVAAATEKRRKMIEDLEKKAKDGRLSLAEVDRQKNALNAELKHSLDALGREMKESSTMRPEVQKYLDNVRKHTNEVVRHNAVEHKLFDTWQKFRGAKRVITKDIPQKGRDIKAGIHHSHRRKVQGLRRM